MTNTQPSHDLTTADIFIERMNRKFQLQGLVLPNQDQAAWAKTRWTPEVVLDQDAAETKAVCFVLDVLSPDPGSVYRDSSVWDLVVQAKKSREFDRSVIMVWNWSQLSSPGDRDFPTVEDVEAECEGRRNYTVAQGNLWISEPAVRPSTVVSKPPKVKISQRYVEEEEVRTDERPYQAYLAAMDSVIDWSKVSSFCDVGCATGLLLKAVKERYKHVQVHGYEFFPYHKENAPALVQQNIQIHDLRDPLHDTNTTWDVVNCTEVGEHIDPAYCEQFIENLRTLCGYRSHLVSGSPRRTILLLSWSSSGGEKDPEHDPRQQHLNPLQPDQVDAMMRSKSFQRQDAATNQFLQESMKHPDFLFGWRLGFGIWTPTWNAARMY